MNLKSFNHLAGLFTFMVQEPSHDNMKMLVKLSYNIFSYPDPKASKLNYKNVFKNVYLINKAVIKFRLHPPTFDVQYFKIIAAVTKQC